MLVSPATFCIQWADRVGGWLGVGVGVGWYAVPVSCGGGALSRHAEIYRGMGV